MAHTRSFLANQKARNAIVRAENLLKNNIHQILAQAYFFAHAMYIVNYDFVLIGLKSTSSFAEFFEYLIASHPTQQLFDSLSIIFIFSSGLHGTSGSKINQSFEPETRSILQTKYRNTIIKSVFAFISTPILVTVWCFFP